MPDWIKGSKIVDLGTFYEMQIQGDGFDYHNYVCNLSKNLDKPIRLIATKGNTIDYYWWTNGVIHNPYGPSHTYQSPNKFLDLHTDQHGKEGRNGGPSFTEHHFGKSYIQKWIDLNGNFHCLDGPATTLATYQTNFPDEGFHITNRSMDWMVNNKYHRNDGLWVHQTDFYLNEKIEITPNNDLIKTETVKERELRWLSEDGDIARYDGPAIVTLHNVKIVTKNGVQKAPWSYTSYLTKWCIGGREIKTLHVMEWAKRNRIKFPKTPCYDQPAFDTETAVCFMADFAGY